MSNRYQTLDVSLNLNNNTLQKESPKRFSSTIDFEDKSGLSNIGENDQRVNKFRQLYFKNEKLRQQLKLLNLKLNEKLEKVKLMPSKKKKAMSVDLNVQKPTKALQRQLQNAYNQVSMYKKQIANLKLKQQSESTYQKYRNLQNQITYKDIEISKVEDQLKSIKSIKKIQDKTLTQDVQNEDLKEKVKQFEKQFNQSLSKLKEIAKKSRKREQQYKKQQAYQVLLEKKIRKQNKEDEEAQQDESQISSNNKHHQQFVNQKDFMLVKDQILKLKTENQTLQKKLEINKKAIRDFKKNRSQCEEKYKGMDAELKTLILKLESLKRLIKDGQRKGSEKQFITGYSTIIQKQGSVTQKQSSFKNHELNQIESEDPSEDEEQNYLNFEKKSKLFNTSQDPSTVKEQRQWNGKTRKVTFGYMESNDSMHKISGTLRGIKVWTDQTKLICGLSFLFNVDTIQKQSDVIGHKTSTEFALILQPNDKLCYINGSFTEQGYLAQLILISTLNQSTRFGTEVGVNKFNCQVQLNEKITGAYCALRKLGNDSRITELGFWINKHL